MKTAAEIVEVLRNACNRHRDGQLGWAREHSISPQFVCDVLKGRRPVTDRLALALGFQRRDIFVKNREKHT